VDFDGIQRFVHEYRGLFYLVTIAWTFLEGESFVLAAGAVAATGVIDPIILTLCAWLGSFAGDQCWFFLGRRFGPLVLRRYPSWRHGIDMVHRWLERWGTVFILTFRFIYGIRNFSAVAIGLSELPALRFMILNFIAAGVWAVCFVTAGYLFEHTFADLLDGPTRYVLLGIFLLVVVIFIIVTRARSRRAKGLAVLPTEHR